MKFSVSEKIFSKFPTAQFGGLFVFEINNNPDKIKEKDKLVRIFEQTIQDIIEKWKGIDIEKLPQINSWRLVFEKLGLNPKEFKPSHEALLRRVLASKKLPRINPLVDIYNIISLKNLIPIGGHDLDKVNEIRIDETSQNSIFKPMGGEKEEKVNDGEMAYMDRDTVLTRNFVWRQSEVDKTTESSKNIFIPIDDASNTRTKLEIQKIAQELHLLISEFLGGKCKFGIVDNWNRVLDEEELPFLKVNEDLRRITIITEKREIITDEEKIDDLLTRTIETVLPSRDELKKVLMSGKRIKLYQGFDPTGPDLHIGHAIGLKVLEKFRRLGHHVIFMFGDFTARIGDPTDKLATRVPLSKEQVEENLKGYREQIKQIVDIDNKTNPVEIKFNSEWLEGLDFTDIIELGKHVTIQQLIERDMFRDRLKKGNPISLSEFIYPIMQGYDSVDMEVDLEHGGNDQLFNMMIGRQLVKAITGKEKFVTVNKLLVDNSGKKMSKTGGNMVLLSDTPENIFGGIMSFSDELILSGLEILTDIPIMDINEMRVQMHNGSVNPMDLKKRLAFEVTKWIKGENAAIEAKKFFEKTVQNEELPEDMPTFELKKLKSNKTNIIDLIEIVKLAKSRGEAKRLVNGGGVELNDKKVTEIIKDVELKTGDILKVGKRNFVRFV